MNQKIKSLLAAALVASSLSSSSFALASGEFGRTKAWLPDLNTSVEYSCHRVKMTEKSDDAIGLTICATGFWHQIPSGTRSGVELGKGFSPFGEQTTKFGNPSEGDKIANLGTVVLGADGSGDKAVSMKISRVEHRRVGARLGACYSLDSFYEGLWVAGSASVLYERNKLTAEFSSNDNTNKENLAKYLKGDYSVSAGQNNPQAALKALKIDNAAHTDTAFNDVQLQLGMRVVNNDNVGVDVCLRGVIPTGTRNKTDFLFDVDPGVRNFKIGAGANVTARLISEEEYSVSFVGEGWWQYGFSRKNQQIIPQYSGSKNNVKVPGAHYAMVAKVGDKQAVPLANVLADNVKVDVESRNEFNAVARVCLERGWLGFELGYNFYYQQERSLKVHGMPEKYQFVKQGISGTAAFSSGDLVEGVIADSDFMDRTPSNAMHRVFGQVSCLFSEWDFPVEIAGGGSYSFSQKRTVTPEYWGVFVRGGISF